jgi:hypothetical protein
MASTNESTRLAEEERVNTYSIAAVWVALALIASLVSIRAGIAVALGEILVGPWRGTSRVYPAWSSKPSSRCSWPALAR